MSLSRSRLFIPLLQSIGKYFSEPVVPRKYSNSSASPLSFHRNFAMDSCSSTTVASFEDVKNVGCLKDTVLIDVREPKELEETGVIPDSINIPLGDVEAVLKDMSGEDFEKCFGKPKPSVNSTIIFSCKAGRRGEKARAIAEQLGFKNTKNFGGGWQEWESKICQ